MDILLSRDFGTIYTWLCLLVNILTFVLYQHDNSVYHIPCLVYIYIQI